MNLAAVSSACEPRAWQQSIPVVGGTPSVAKTGGQDVARSWSGVQSAFSGSVTCARCVPLVGLACTSLDTITASGSAPLPCWSEIMVSGLRMVAPGLVWHNHICLGKQVCICLIWQQNHWVFRHKTVFPIAPEVGWALSCLSSASGHSSQLSSSIKFWQVKLGSALSCSVTVTADAGLVKKSAGFSFPEVHGILIPGDDRPCRSGGHSVSRHQNAEHEQVAQGFPGSDQVHDEHGLLNGESRS